MARMNRTGTRLTAREVRSMYPALSPGFFGIVPDDDAHSHSEIVAPEWTSNPCHCVTPCPAGTGHSAIRPLQYLWGV